MDGVVAYVTADDVTRGGGVNDIGSETGTTAFGSAADPVFAAVPARHEGWNPAPTFLKSSLVFFTLCAYENCRANCEQC